MTSFETHDTAPLHFEDFHENDETLVCVQHGGVCSVLIELDGMIEQQRYLSLQTKRAIQLLDNYFYGDFATLFSGVRVCFSNEIESGGETDHDNNTINLHTDKMSLSLVDAEAYLVSSGVLNQGDWTRTYSGDESSQPASCAMYNLIHEFAHLMDERRDGNGPWIGIPKELGPTLYGRTKDNEAFAEAFTYQVLGAQLSDAATISVNNKVHAFIEKTRTAQAA